MMATGHRCLQMGNGCTQLVTHSDEESDLTSAKSLNPARQGLASSSLFVVTVVLSARVPRQPTSKSAAK